MCGPGTVLTATTVVGRVTMTAKIPWPTCEGMMKHAFLAPSINIAAPDYNGFLAKVVDASIAQAGTNPTGVTLTVLPSFADAAGAGQNVPKLAATALLGYANTVAGGQTSYGQLTASGSTIGPVGTTGGEAATMAAYYWTVAEENRDVFVFGVTARLAAGGGTCAAGTNIVVDCASYGSTVVASAGDTALTYVWAP